MSSSLKGSGLPNGLETTSRPTRGFSVLLSANGDVEAFTMERPNHLGEDQTIDPFNPAVLIRLTICQSADLCAEGPTWDWS
jgi:hypothetical protein